MMLDILLPLHHLLHFPRKNSFPAFAVHVPAHNSFELIGAGFFALDAPTQIILVRASFIYLIQKRIESPVRRLKVLWLRYASTANEIFRCVRREAPPGDLFGQIQRAAAFLLSPVRHLGLPQIFVF